jgi:hypothetical protein
MRRMKPDAIAPNGFGLVHRRIGLHEYLFLRDRFAREQHHANTGGAVMFNVQAVAVSIRERKQVRF